MYEDMASGGIRRDCERCWLRRHPKFREFSLEELRFVSSFKKGEVTLDAGATVLREGEVSNYLYTVLEGWAFRHKLLEDGRRQILNYVVPGDLVGLQGTLIGEMQHSVEALTSIQLCVFERERIPELFQNHAGLAYDLTWIAAQEERILDEHLLSVGRRTAVERAAYLLAFLATRAIDSGLSTSRTIFLPVTQQHLADTLGLSIVHTNKTLRKLAARDIIRWLERGCEVTDIGELRSIAGWHAPEPRPRPFI